MILLTISRLINSIKLPNVIYRFQLLVPVVISYDLIKSTSVTGFNTGFFGNGVPSASASILAVANVDIAAAFSAIVASLLEIVAVSTACGYDSPNNKNLSVDLSYY